jgi:hypothetical protein
VDEAAFRNYIENFNAANYDVLVDHFADDMTLTYPDGSTLNGREEFVAFYKKIHASVKEVLRIDFLLIGADKVAVELYTEFHAQEDVPDFPGAPLAKGEVRRITSFVHYDMDESGKFNRIRVARYLSHDA